MTRRRGRMRAAWAAPLLAAVSAALVAPGCASTPETDPPKASTPAVASPAPAAPKPPEPEDPRETAPFVVAQASAQAPEAAPDVPEGTRTLPPPDPDSGTGTLLIYTAITGHHPFDPNAPGAATSTPDHWTADGEAARGRALEAQIEEELRRKQEAVDGIQEGAGRPTIESLITGETVAERANPRIAPAAPADRELPLSVFALEPATILPGSWGNSEALEVTRAALDADRDGRPEEIRYLEVDTRALLRKEDDTNYDGAVDTWQSYSSGELVLRVRDTDDDGEADVWERYGGGRMIGRTIDRNRNGVPDAFYDYEGETLVEERHDADDDGVVDRRIRYENLYRVRAEEDRDRDGAMDTWTTYGVSRGEEVVTKVERATRGHGPPDVVETYDTSSGRSVLAKREEDRNGDGSVDVTSHYQNGKLVQREIADPELAPL